MSRKLSIILFYGGLWGIIESTLGTVLHTIPLKIGSFIWYPLAIYMMSCTYRDTKEKKCILWVSILAALIKLTTLTLPIRLDKVINPAVSILLEGMALSFMLCMRSTYPKTTIGKFSFAFMCNTAWRSLYVAYLYLAPTCIKNASLTMSQSELCSHFIGKNLITTLIITGIMITTNNFSKKSKISNKLYNPICGIMFVICSILLRFT